jgi:hypothetical protein
MYGGPLALAHSAAVFMGDSGSLDFWKKGSKSSFRSFRAISQFFVFRTGNCFMLITGLFACGVDTAAVAAAALPEGVNSPACGFMAKALACGFSDEDFDMLFVVSPPPLFGYP